MTAEAAGWVAMEFEGMDLGDERLNRRAVTLTEQLAAKPMASIPGACGGIPLLSQEEMSWQDILQPHWQRTQERMVAHGVVLCLQETTESGFDGQEIAGLGPLSYVAQRGMYLHPTYAVTPKREPLGLLDAWMWARDSKNDEGERAQIGEGLRWIEGYERVAERAAELPNTRLVYVADRESDVIVVMLRAQHNRALSNGGKLWVQKGWWARREDHLARTTARHRLCRRPASRPRALRAMRCVYWNGLEGVTNGTRSAPAVGVCPLTEPGGYILMLV